MAEEKVYKRGPMSEEHKAKIAEAHKGKKFTEEHKEKISLSHIGVERTPEWLANLSKAKEKYRKPVIQLDLQGNEIRRFESVSAAVRTLGLHKSALSACLNGRARTAGGYKWIWAEKENGDAR